MSGDTIDLHHSGPQSHKHLYPTSQESIYFMYKSLLCDWHKEGNILFSSKKCYRKKGYPEYKYFQDLFLPNNSRIKECFKYIQDPSLYSKIPSSIHSYEPWECIIHLEPRPGTPLYSFLIEKAALVIMKFGADPTHCYLPHCSLSGFFECVHVPYLINNLNHILQGHIMYEYSVIQYSSQNLFICTEDGYVVLTLRCPVANDLIHLLEEKMTNFSTHVRSKRIDHITLASQRFNTTERYAIADLYSELTNHTLLHQSLWDIVLYKMEKKSSGFGTEGRHILRELKRFPTRLQAVFVV